MSGYKQKTFCFGLEEKLQILPESTTQISYRPLVIVTLCDCCKLNPYPKHCFKGFKRAATNRKRFALVRKKSCRSGEHNADFIPPLVIGTWCHCCQLNPDPKHCFKRAATNRKRFALISKKSGWSGEQNADFIAPPCYRYLMWLLARLRKVMEVEAGSPGGNSFSWFPLRSSRTRHFSSLTSYTAYTKIWNLTTWQRYRSYHITVILRIIFLWV